MIDNSTSTILEVHQAKPGMDLKWPNFDPTEQVFPKKPSC